MTERAAAVVVTPSLVPGATGRQDVRAARREQVCAVLAHVVAGRSPGSGTDGAPSGRVVVVAPTRRDEGRTTDVGPDTGALGIAADGPVPVQGGLLDVTASVAVLMLRGSGWDGPVTSVEVSAHDRPALPALLTTLSEMAGGGGAVVVACASEDGELGEGAPSALREAERLVHEIARGLTPQGYPGGPRGTRTPEGS